LYNGKCIADKECNAPCDALVSFKGVFFSVRSIFIHCLWKCRATYQEMFGIRTSAPNVNATMQPKPFAQRRTVL
jgi:hypothetical protein